MKLDALHRCFELGESVNLVSEEIGYTNYEEQVEILKSRNLIIENEDRAISILQRVNYYRLSAYILTYKKDDGLCEKVLLKMFMLFINLIKTYVILYHQC